MSYCNQNKNKNLLCNPLESNLAGQFSFRTGGNKAGNVIDDNECKQYSQQCVPSSPQLADYAAECGHGDFVYILHFCFSPFLIQNPRRNYSAGACNFSITYSAFLLSSNFSSNSFILFTYASFIAVICASC